MAADFNEWARAQGFDPEQLSTDQKLFLNGAWRNSANADVQTLDALQERFRAEAPDQIDAVDEVAERARAGGWSARQAELQMLRASRGSGPQALQPSRPQAQTGDVLSAGLMLSLGFGEREVGAQFEDAEHVMNQATRAPMRRLTLNAVLRMVAQSGGRRLSPGKLGNDDIRAVFEVSRGYAPGLNAVGPSTLSVSGILSNVANKAMLIGYGTVGTVWNKFCRVSPDVPDFKPFKRYRLTVEGQFAEVPGGGELKHVGLSEFEAEGQLAQYGCLIALDRKQIINDDLSAFAALPKGLGRLGAVTLERAVFTTLLANTGDFFGTANGNISEGTDTVIGDTGLEKAYQKLQEQTDDNGDPILVPPRVILVPPAGEKTARKLTRDTGVVVAGDTDRTEPNGNPWAGMFDPVSSPYLGTALGLPGASNTGWYLTVAPGDFSPIEVAFLQGNTAPIVESGELDFDRLGMSFRAYHDWGVAQLDPRGAVWSTGVTSG